MLDASVTLDERAELLRRVQDALGTAETGDGLVQVARDAHAAERELAALRRRADEDDDDVSDAVDYLQRRIAAAGRVS
jgi:hypothetical protein